MSKWDLGSLNGSGPLQQAGQKRQMLDATPLHRSRLSAEKHDQILFLRENSLMAKFDLGWM